jgi:four helix bundle protein
MGGEYQTHKDLDVWKLGLLFVKDIYVVTKKFPAEELYGLTSQLRRAAVSVPTNIAEGAAKNSRKEFVRFLYISLGSLVEIETLLHVAELLNYCEISQLMESSTKIRMKLLNLIKYQKSKI